MLVMRYIPLTQGKVTIVDDEDYEYLMQWSWHYAAGGYAARGYRVKGSRSVQKIYMHRLLHKTPEGFDTDHENRNKLDNQKHNLVTKTRSANNVNAGPQKNSKSGYRGVSWDKQKNKWVARCKYQGKYYHIGFFESPRKASAAYLEFVATHYS